MSRGMVVIRGIVKAMRAAVDEGHMTLDELDNFCDMLDEGAIGLVVGGDEDDDPIMSKRGRLLADLLEEIRERIPEEYDPKNVKGDGREKVKVRSKSSKEKLRDVMDPSYHPLTGTTKKEWPKGEVGTHELVEYHIEDDEVWMRMHDVECGGSIEYRLRRNGCWAFYESSDPAIMEPRDFDLEEADMELENRVTLLETDVKLLEDRGPADPATPEGDRVSRSDKGDKGDSIERSIVAEISQNYVDEKACHLEGYPTGLSPRFELVIGRNRERGYRLRDWQLDRVESCGPKGETCLNEMIIAVFDRVGEGEVIGDEWPR